MKKSKLKVFIPASGVGSGLGEVTKYRNKTLIRVGTKPVIAHIIESYPHDTQFVISLGHFGKQVKDFLLLAYPDRSFTFVQIDRYQGKGSSLGYSMIKSLPHLQSPFIFHASDTIILEKIPSVTTNWIGGYNGEGSSNYTSFNVLNGKIQKIMEKGIINPDFLHIGLVGVADYKKFSDFLKKLYTENTYGDSLADIHVWNKLIAEGIDFKIREFKTWLDTGNTDSLKIAQDKLAGSFYNLDKPKESIFFINNNAIKFTSNDSTVKQIIKRSKILKGFVPEITTSLGNFYSYKYVKGNLYSDVATPHNFLEFLNWSQKKLWQPVKEVPEDVFRKECLTFYYKKTYDRIHEFFDSRKISDTENIINEEKVPTVKELFKKIDFNSLSNASQTLFHGDYILDNIIKTSKGYTLLDWRASFGSLLKAGDMYYDLAKLNHNLTVNHDIIHRKLFSISINGKHIQVDIFRKENLVQCQQVLHNFILEKGYDLNKVKLLTSLIWFSSAPLHHHPYDTFLFYFAKMNLWRTLTEKE